VVGRVIKHEQVVLDMYIYECPSVCRCCRVKEQYALDGIMTWWYTFMSQIYTFKIKSIIFYC